MQSSPANNDDLGTAIDTVRFSLGQTGKILWAFVVLGPVMGIVMLVAAWQTRPFSVGVAALGVGGLVFVGVSPLLLRFLLRSRVWRLTVLDKGLEIFHRSGLARLRYDDIEEFGFERRDNQSGCTYMLTFIAGQGDNAETHRWSSTADHPIKLLDDLRDQVTQIIAARMLQQFEVSGELQWTPNLTIRRDALEYCVMGSSKRTLLPYAQIDHTDLIQTDFRLYETEKKMHVFWCPHNYLNFFPGLAVFEIVRQRHVQT